MQTVIIAVGFATNQIIAVGFATNQNMHLLDFFITIENNCNDFCPQNLFHF